MVRAHDADADNAKAQIFRGGFFTRIRAYARCHPIFPKVPVVLFNMARLREAIHARRNTLTNDFNGLQQAFYAANALFRGSAPHIAGLQR
jgi:hypothetical protein